MTLKASLRPSRAPFTALVVGLVIAVIGLVVSKRLPSDIPTTIDFSQSQVIHVTGTMNIDGSEDPFELWYDPREERFAYKAGANNEFETVFEAGRITTQGSGESTVHNSMNADFEDSVVKGLTHFAYALDPDYRKYFTEGESETLNGVTYETVKDRADRTYLLRNDNLPAYALFRGSVIEFSYDTIEEVAHASISPNAFVSNTPEAGSDVSSGFQYPRSDPESFVRVYDFSEYDVYWLGLEYESWSCLFAQREVHQGPDTDERAILANQPGKIEDSIVIGYQSTEGKLVVLTIPTSAITYDAGADSRATPVALDNQTAYVIAFDNGGTLYLNKPGVQVQISGPDVSDLIDAADDLMVVQKGGPSSPNPTTPNMSTPAPTSTPTLTPFVSQCHMRNDSARISQTLLLQEIRAC